ncbi:MAG: TIGR01548 family HAD-type hydrolase [Nanoarchaeota archaeon]
MKAVIFDMDGVLVDVSSSYRRTIIETVEFFINQKITDNDIQKLKDKGGYNNDWDLTKALIGKGIPKSDIQSKFQEIYLGSKFDGLIRNDRWLMEPKLLKQLRDKFRLGIVTGRPRPEAEYALRCSKTTGFFDVLITMDDYPEQKPDPVLLERALKKLNCTEGYYIGDTIDDMQMAVNAGMIGIGITSAQYLKTLFITNGAGFVIDNVNQITEVLKCENP